MNLNSLVVITVSRCKYRLNGHIPPHYHNFYHLICVSGGSGVLYLNNHPYKVPKNTLYLIRPGVLHEIFSSRSDPLCTIEIKFYLSDERLEHEINRYPLELPDERKLFKAKLDWVIEEAIAKQPLFKEVIAAGFLEILLQIVRQHHYGSEGTVNLHPGDFPVREEAVGCARRTERLPLEHERMSDIMQYIHLHYHEKVTLSELAHKFAMNQTQLCKTFSLIYGIAPIQYLNNYRMKRTKELLANTGMSITEIAEQVGFQSVHYLSRCFARKEGFSPLEYRQRVVDSIWFTVEEKCKFKYTPEIIDSVKVMNTSVVVDSIPEGNEESQYG
jgi:AraC-like DNA-binding protein